jgi:hypothetical protein
MKPSELRLNLALAFLALFALLVFPARAQQRPLITEDVDIVAPGAVRIEFGFDFVQGKQFPLSGLEGDLSRIGVVSLTMGLAPNVEVEMGGVVHNALSINRRFQPSAIPLDLSNPNSTNDVGDFFVATKIKLRNESRRLPAIGTRFGVQLPNSNQARGIGVNQTNYFSTLLATKNFGRLKVTANVGLGIFTAPVDLFTQNDVLLYGLSAAYRVNERVTLLGEVNGRANTRRNVPRGTESDNEARFGARFRAAGLMWDFAGITGFARQSPHSGVTFGVTYEGQVFTPVK